MARTKGITMTNHNDGLMPVKEFCQWARIGPSTFYEEIKAGRLRAVKIGRCTYVRRPEALRWADELPDFNAPTTKKGAAHLHPAHA